MSSLRQNLRDSISLEDALNTPAARAGYAVFQLRETVKELEALNKDPITHRHVRASREELRRMTVRMHHLLGS